MKIGAIILAAGRGKRMQAFGVNKVTVHLANKPMVLHTVHLLEKMDLASIVVVVGHESESVKEVLSQTNVIFAHQEEQLGTADAALCGLRKLPHEISDIFIFYGDDSAFYNQKILGKIIDAHQKSNADLTFLTIEVPNPTGLGRVIRGEEGNVQAIVEEKDATPGQKAITEINPACYIFKTSFLKQYLPKIEKSPVTGEYYLTSLIDIAIKNKKKIQTVRGGALPWRGVNTKEELLEAEKLFIQSLGR